MADQEIEVKVQEKEETAMVYVMTEEFVNSPAKPAEYYFNVIARGYIDSNLNLKPLQVAYSECLHEVGC